MLVFSNSAKKKCQQNQERPSQNHKLEINGILFNNMLKIGTLQEGSDEVNTILLPMCGLRYGG